MALLNFLKPKNQLEEGRTAALVQQDAGEPEKKCPNCHREIPLSHLWANRLVCTCGYHFRMKARQRIKMLTDKGSFQELYTGIRWKMFGQQAARRRLSSAELQKCVDRNAACL